MQNDPLERFGCCNSVPNGSRNALAGGSRTIRNTVLRPRRITEPDIRSLRSIREGGLEAGFRRALYELPISSSCKLLAKSSHEATYATFVGEMPKYIT